MSLFYKILLSVASVLIFAGCLERIEPREKVFSGREIARVGDAALYDSNIKEEIYPAGITREDSVKLLAAYVDTWIRRQIKLQEAEKLFSGEGVDIEAKVADYRTSLLTRNLERYYVESQLDTAILPSEITDYFTRHRADFILDRAIIKGRVVRVPNTFRQQAELKTLMGSTTADKRQDFLDMCAKNNLELTEYGEWTDFRQLLTLVPTTIGRSYDYMLPVRKVQELSDADNKYYIQITGSMKKGEQAPLEWVEHIVRRIIITGRSNDIIRTAEDSLYNAAVSSNKVIVNITY